MYRFAGQEITTPLGLFELLEVVLNSHQVGYYSVEVHSLGRVCGFFFEQVFILYIVFSGYGLFYFPGAFFELFLCQFPPTFGWGKLTG